MYSISQTRGPQSYHRPQICGTQTCHISIHTLPPSAHTHTHKHAHTHTYTPTQFYLQIFGVVFGLDDLEFDSGQGKRCFCSSECPDWLWDPPSLLFIGWGCAVAMYRQPASGAVPPHPLCASFQFPHSVFVNVTFIISLLQTYW